MTLKHEEEKLRKTQGFSSTITIQEKSEHPESDSESDDDGNGNRSNNKLEKRPEKLTQTQRNKLRKRKLLKYEQRLADREKFVLRGINALPYHISKIEKLEKQQEMKRNAMKLLKKSREVEDKKALTYQEVGVIPLTDELNGSLRQIKPKGIAVVEQVHSMVKVGDLMAKDRRERRRGEKPHAGKRVKWIPKYKYGISG